MNHKRICRIGIAAALYAVFSVTLKFPLIGNTYLDLGYLVLTVSCFLCAPLDCALIGAIGCSVVNLCFSPLGFSPSHLVCNLILGGGCALLLQSGACQRLRAKNKAFKSQCFGLAFGCVVAGVTEPAIYGVNLRLKRPLIGVICGAAAGGGTAPHTGSFPPGTARPCCPSA